MLARRLIYLAGLALFYVNLCLLILASCSPYINPKIFWPPALLGLFFKILFFVHLLFTTWYIFRKQKRMLRIAILALLPCIPALTTFANLWPRHDNIAEGRRLRIMTYNVRSFAWYEDTLGYRQITENIANTKPDILCMQEYCIYTPKHKNTLKFLLGKAGFKYYYEYITSVISSRDKVGLAFFSKVPFSDITPIPFNNSGNGAFYADFNLGPDTFRVYNVHFQSIGLREREYRMPASFSEIEDQRINLLRVSLNKFRQGFRKRSVQVEDVKQEIQNSPYKTLVCGDFNDTPVSFLYQEMTERLNDTWLQCNIGLGSTFAGDIPFQRIDYILADPQMKIGQTQVLRKPGSDHYPLVCDFSLK